jgi:hypothetical protein
VLLQVVSQHQLVCHGEPVRLHGVVLAKVEGAELACSSSSSSSMCMCNESACCYVRDMEDMAGGMFRVPGTQQTCCVHNALHAAATAAAAPHQHMMGVEQSRRWPHAVTQHCWATDMCPCDDTKHCIATMCAPVMIHSTA